MSTAPSFSLDQLIQNTGASADQLRTWGEVGLPLAPAANGRYDTAQMRVAMAMQALTASGMSAEESAEIVLRSEERWRRSAALQTSQAVDYAQVISQLCDRIHNFDNPGCLQLLDPICDARPLEEVISQLFMPLMKEVGQQWECGAMSVAQEHFTTGLIMRRLSSMTWTWAHNEGSSVLLACPPDELHDLPLLSFGAALSARDWRVCYLGANVPWPDMVAAAAGLDNDAIVLASTRPEPFLTNPQALHDLAQFGRLYLAGAGATPEVIRQLGCGEHLAGDPISAVSQLERERSDSAPRRAAG